MAKRSGVIVIRPASVVFEEDGKERIVEGLVTTEEVMPMINVPFKYDIITGLNGLAIGLTKYPGYDDANDIFMAEEEIDIPENDMLPIKVFSISRLDDECIEHVVTDINYC